MTDDLNAICSNCQKGTHDRGCCSCPVCAGRTSAVEFGFDRTTHTYWLGGRLLPSVTQIIQGAGIGEDYSMVPADVLERKTQIGIAVHAASHYVDEGDLDESSLDPAVGGYIGAYRRFRTESGFEPAGWEQPMFHPAGWAGTPDRWGRLHGWRVLIDLKTVYTLNARSVSVQVAGGYGPIVERRTGVRIQRHFALHLRPDETYRLVPTEHPMARHVFQAAFAKVRGHETPQSQALLTAWQEGTV